VVVVQVENFPKWESAECANTPSGFAGVFILKNFKLFFCYESASVHF
jgi:hypothetical protein